MKIILISYWNFNSPSGMHIFHLANALSRNRLDVTVYCRQYSSSALDFGKPKFKSYGTADFPPSRVARYLAAERGDYILHSWTPRESARVLTSFLSERLDAPYIVHMEDNEEAIFKAQSSFFTLEELTGDSVWEPGGKLFYSSHPVRHKDFLASAQGYTCIIESLLDFKPAHVSGHVVWPACEPAIFTLPPRSSADAKARWGIPVNCPVIFYPGNVHENNVDEVRELYCAVRMLHEAGIAARIIKFGTYCEDIPGQTLEAHGFGEALIDLTHKITPAQIPDVLQAADYLIQPGRDNRFNHYRFPCKLPMFLASGRPVILPVSNLGHHLKHKENCLLLQNGGAEEIYQQLIFLLQHPGMAVKLGDSGREFARQHFSWDKSAERLTVYYKQVLDAWKKTKRVKSEH